MSGFLQKSGERRFHHRATLIEPVSPRQNTNRTRLGRDRNHGLPLRFFQHGQFRLETFLLLPTGKRLRRQFGLELREAQALALRVDIDFRGAPRWQIIGSNPEMLSFVDISKKGPQRLKVSGGVGIILMVMTLGTTHCCTHPDIGEVPNPVRKVDGEIFLGLNSALV